MGRMIGAGLDGRGVYGVEVLKEWRRGYVEQS